MITIALLVSSIVLVEILMIIGVCFWQAYKEDIQWYIYTLLSDRD